MAKVIDASYEIVRWNIPEDVYAICRGYCVCYATKPPQSFVDQCRFIKAHRIHESPLEHSILTVEFTINRGVSHELVRHRHCGYSQESTRYCNYSNNRFDNDLTFIEDSHIIRDSKAYDIWIKGLENNVKEYFALLDAGMKPEEARGCLPNDLKTKIIVSTNYREWKSIFKLRCDSHAHYQMREIMTPLRNELIEKLPCVFDDLA